MPKVSNIDPRKVLARVLVVFALGSVTFMAVKDIVARFSEPDPVETAKEGNPRYIVYYFSVGKECTTCESIEAYTKEALVEYYTAPLANGEIEWRTRDMDDPRHEHFAEDYDLYTKSIVLVDAKDGRFKNLTEVWDLVGDQHAFVEYIHQELEAFMEPALTEPTA
mgnify:CR=1 FL=1